MGKHRVPELPGALIKQARGTERSLWPEFKTIQVMARCMRQCQGKEVARLADGAAARRVGSQSGGEILWRAPLKGDPHKVSKFVPLLIV
jgi:hypothetical protein